MKLVINESNSYHLYRNLKGSNIVVPAPALSTLLEKLYIEKQLWLHGNIFSNNPLPLTWFGTTT